MIILHEHFEYGESKGYLEPTYFQHQINLLEAKNRYTKAYGQDKSYCFNISYKETEDKFFCQTSYFVGIDWIIDNKLSIYVQPKQNNQQAPKNTIEIDHLKMLFEALKEPKNFNHLDGLCQIDFHRPMISISQKQDQLSLFLVVEYIQLLKHLVKKGLKKSYYQEVKPLEAKIKGKILAGQSIKYRTAKQKLTHNVCQYQILGINSNENKLLKKAFLFAQKIIDQHPELDITELKAVVSYIRPTLSSVDDNIELKDIENFKPNPFYKEYDRATQIALMLLKRFAYNTSLPEKKDIPTPPYWIDMSKLFELYIYKKLKDLFPNTGEVQYHVRAHRQELDYLLNAQDNQKKSLKMVIDAKYKPKYINNNDKDDARQLAGYSRLKKVYEKLELDKAPHLLIDGLIIYPDQEANEFFDIDNLKTTSIDGYVNFYKIGIKLPEV